jgi:hypothetical protein
MTSTPGNTAPEDEPTTDSPAGAEIGITEGEGSTFEPEEDPEGHAD